MKGKNFHLDVFIFALLVAASLGSLSTIFYGDACGNYLVLESLKIDEDLDLRNQRDLCAGSAQDMFALGKSGEWYSVHELGWPVLAYPAFRFLGIAGIILLNSLVLMISLRAIAEVCNFHSSTTGRIVATLMVAATTPILFSAATFGTDMPGAALLATATYLILTNRPILAGLVWGAIFLVRVHLVLSLPALLILFVSNTGIRLSSVLRFAAGALLPFLAFLAQNYILFGNALEFSYQRSIHDETGAGELLRNVSIMELPSISRMWNLLFAPEHGVFRAQLIFLPTWLFGLPVLAKKSKALASFSLIGFATFLVFYSCFPGEHVASRYFTFFMMWTMLPLSVLWTSVSRLAGASAKTKEPKEDGLLR